MTFYPRAKNVGKLELCFGQCGVIVHCKQINKRRGHTICIALCMGIRIPASGNFLMWNLEFRNTAQRIRNPTNDCNLEGYFRYPGFVRDSGIAKYLDWKRDLTPTREEGFTRIWTRVAGILLPICRKLEQSYVALGDQPNESPVVSSVLSRLPLFFFRFSSSSSSYCGMKDCFVFAMTLEHA